MPNYRKEREFIDATYLTYGSVCVTTTEVVQIGKSYLEMVAHP